MSIYESNSQDETPALLSAFSQRLDAHGVQHRVLSDTTDRWWPYGTSPERIGFLADARNKAMEPLQSPDAGVRLRDYDSFTKVLFLNDVLFTWESAVRLLGTRLDDDGADGDYDLACGLDFGASGERFFLPLSLDFTAPANERTRRRGRENARAWAESGPGLASGVGPPSWLAGWLAWLDRPAWSGGTCLWAVAAV